MKKKIGHIIYDKICMQIRKKKIDNIIFNNGTLQDIQKEIPDFPLDPTIEYFISLGYNESVAQRYWHLLRKSEQEQAIEIAPQTPNIIMESCIFVKSTYANLNNLLVDTCALGYFECTDLIDQAKQVTFIYSTLEEMDKIASTKFNSKGSKTFLKNIKLYESKVLLEPDKFLLSRFSGYNNEKYVDKILLQYLEILPKQIRPTLLTADRNLATKAQTLGFDYILRMPKNSNVKNLGYGIKLFENGDELFIEYRGTQQLFILHGTTTIPYTSGKQKIERGDSLLLKLKSKDNISEYQIQI